MPGPFRNVLVTGASSGLGRGLALHYARAGATVHAVARRTEELERLAAEAGAAGRVVPLPLDVTDGEALEAAVRRAEAASGGALDLVVAAAGVGAPTSGRRLDWRVARRILDVNATAACVTVGLALPAMVERGAGTVAAVASLAGFVATPSSAAYCASKAALQRFMEGLRLDLAGTGVRAVTINPGFVKTPMTDGQRQPMPFLMELDEAVRRMVAGLEAGRAGVSFPLPMVALARGMAALPRALAEPMLRRGRKG